MKKYKSYFQFIFISIIFWLIFSLLCSDMNALNWHIAVKLWYIYLTGLTSIIIIVLTYDN